jgi:hypothetical protein
MAFDNLAIIKVDFGEDSETPDDSSNRVPVHLNKVPRFCRA